MNDILNELKDLFSATINSVDSDRIKTFYVGEVKIVPQSYLPALMVIPRSTTVIAKSTEKDQYEYSITVRVEIDLKKFLKEGGTGTTISAMEEITKIMEERETTQVLKADTVLGILRANIKGTKYLFNNDLSVNYEVIENPKWPIVRADCELTAITNLISRP